MSDKASRETDRLLRELQKELNDLYDMTDKEIDEAIEQYLNMIYLDDYKATQKKRLEHAKDNGLDLIISIFVYKMLSANNNAVNSINNVMLNVSEINYNHIRDKIISKKNIDIGLKLSEYIAGKYSQRAYDRAVNSKYLTREVNKAIQKSIKLGNNVKGIARDIRKVSNRSRNSAKTTARTETTRIRSASRLDAIREANKQGITVKKIWRHSPAGKVGNPRHWHIDMDGETIDWNEVFSNGLKYPGEVGAPAEEVINCGCYLDEEVI